MKAAILAAGLSVPDLVEKSDVDERYRQALDTDCEMGETLSAAERSRREAMLSFVDGLLTISPSRRWTPRQALTHPFDPGQPFAAEAPGKGPRGFEKCPLRSPTN
mgnify:CR=1 FL=1